MQQKARRPEALLKGFQRHGKEASTRVIKRVPTPQEGSGKGGVGDRKSWVHAHYIMVAKATRDVLESWKYQESGGGVVRAPSGHANEALHKKGRPRRST
jgi:hypothetical protein